MFARIKFPTKVDQILRDIAEKQGYLTYKICKQYITIEADSLFAKLYEVDIYGKTKNDKGELNLFVKINYSGGESPSWVSMTSLYGTELFTYTDLYKMFEKLQDDAMIPPQDRYRMVRCFGGSNNEAIVLENIARKGYTTYPRTDVVSLELAQKCIRELAKFHALSFALEEIRPENFNSYKLKKIKYPINLGDEWFGFMETMMKTSIIHVNDTVKDKVERTYYKLAKKYKQYFLDKATKRCICHGDVNVGNFMVKRDGEESDIVLIDYQFLHYGCPVIDFIYYIFLSTDKKFRDAHLSELKDLYYETLSKFLEHFHIDVEFVYPKRMFDRVYKEKLGYGLMLGFTILPFMFADKKNTLGLTQELSGLSLPVGDAFIERQRGIIEEFIEWGYID